MLVIPIVGAMERRRERLHAVGQKHRHELLLQRLTGRGLLEPRMEGIESENRDDVDVPVQQLAQDVFGQDVTGGLHDPADALVIAVLLIQLFEGGVQHGFANGLEQDLAAGKNHTATLLAQLVHEVQINHLIREIVDEAPEIRL
jgi:hypothetical protein